MTKTPKIKLSFKGVQVKVDQTAYRRAMLEQRRLKPDYFPVGNRAARRAAKSEERRTDGNANTTQDRAGREPR